ncbi:MAG: right-handed parallel beta-helix repeat-containing protein, partial [Anaerolineae bacterium]
MNSSRVVTVVGWSLLGLALALLYPPVIHAANLTVCLAGSPTCDYAVIQEAVDAASDGDVIKVASGEYTEINNHGSLAQVVYIDKSIIIRGGYTAPDFSEPPDPQANPTTLDAKEGGRALYITGSASPVVEGLRLTGGDANALGGGPFGRDAGGGVYISTATATLRDNQVLSNTAEWYGGGVYVHSSLDVTLSENEISHNTTHHGGGGGSGLYLSESNVTLSDNTISNNTATGSGIVYGGGLYLSYSTANLSSNTISGNTATWSLYDSYGGGVYVTGSDATFDGDTISGNHARSGGGLYLDESDTTVNDSTVLDNEAGDHGGGLYVFGGDVTVSHNTISGNHALKRGGGLYLSGSAGSLDENVFSENTASSDGGGMYVAYSNPTLTNNVIADNEANTASGVYLLASSPDLLHTTIAHNGSTVLTVGGSARSIPSALRTFEEPMSHTGGDGIGLYVKNWDTDYSEVNLTNTILAGHTVGIYVAGGNTATLEATLWASNDRDWDGAGAIFTGTVNVRGDPAFVNPGNGDYHISSGSAAIDEGVNAGVNIDIDGEPRPLDGGYDIGA